MMQFKPGLCKTIKQININKVYVNLSINNCGLLGLGHFIFLKYPTIIL
jgi:hypothetical protein